MQNYDSVYQATQKYKHLLSDFNVGFTPNGTNQIPSGQTVDLPPGTYEENIVVSSGSVLRLETGSYKIGSLTVQSGAKIELQGSGKIDLDIAGSLQWDGSFQGIEIEEAARRLKVRVKDSKMLFLHTSFGGFLVAPNAHVVVGQADKKFAGQIYAEYITLHQDTRFRWVLPE